MCVGIVIAPCFPQIYPFQRLRIKRCMDVYRKSISSLIIFFALVAFSTQSVARIAAPTEVLSDVTITKYKGKTAVKVDFAFPIRYVSHDVINRGSQIMVNLRISSREVADISQLPLLQTMLPPRDAGHIPLEEVTYETDSDGPKLNIRFREPVDIKVSQALGVTSILLILPDNYSASAKGKDAASSKTSFFGGFVPEPAKTGKKMDPQRLEKLFNQGKTYLRNGDNKKAIDLFASLLTLPQHEKTMECLELLGLARERNGQVAHARTIYEEYLKRYPKDKSSDRIKQRLADLSEDRMQPKQPLKKNEETRQSKNVGQSFFYGTIAQYYDNLTDVGPDETITYSSAIDSQISIFHRNKSSSHDWRNTLIMREYYDERDGSDGIAIGSMYTKYKNNTQNFSVTLGRHNANNIPGVLGKFDGFNAGAQATEKFRMNIAAGYPVSTADKQHVQTHKLFKVFNLEMSEVIKGWDISPYVATQKTDSIISRSAYGSDFRYYHDKGDIYMLIEYDQVFKDWLTTNFQSKYDLTKKTTINFSYEDQKNIDLENALLRFDNAEQIQDIIDRGVWTAEDLANLVRGTSANSRQTTLSLKHSFSKTLSITLRWAKSIRDYVEFTNLPNDGLTSVLPENYDQFRRVAPDVESDDYSVRLVTSESFHPRDSTIMYFSFTDSAGHIGQPNIAAYTSSRLSINYRRPFGDKLQTNSSLSYRDRVEKDSINKLTKITPKETITYYMTKKFKWYMEFSWEYTDDTQPDNNGISTTLHDDIYSFYGGYIWDF